MKNSIIIKSLFAVLLASTVNAAEWTIDTAHTEIGFTAKHMVVARVNGAFNEYSGQVTLDPENITSAKIKGVVKVASINTGNEARDNHLRTSDFFDAENYPEIVFESTEILKSESGYIAVGNLTMRGVTKSIQLPFQILGPVNDPWGKTRVGIEAKGTINRLDWGVAWNKVIENNGLLVSNEIELRINAELIKN